MHAFEFRLTQLLDSVGGLTAGRRQRLTRTLRQDDVELGVRPSDPVLDAAMKASLRVAAHEVLDAFCMHLEGALARCRNDHVRTLLMAIVSVVMAEHGCVLFSGDGGCAGVEFPATEKIVIAVSPGKDCDLMLERRAGDGPHARRVWLSIVDKISERRMLSDSLGIDATAIEANPYAEAANVIATLRG